MRVIIYALDTAVRSLSLFSAIQSMIHEFLKPSIGAWKRDSGTGKGTCNPGVNGCSVLGIAMLGAINPGLQSK